MSDPATTPVPATDPTDGRTTRRRGPSPRVQRALMILLLLGALAGLGWTVALATTGNDGASSTTPEFVDRLIPDSGSEVLRQATVGIDVANGYDAALIVNGEEIRTAQDGLVKDLGSGSITFTPGEGRAVESLQPEQNCVTALVWRITEGEDSAVPVSWCFNAA